MLKGKKRTRRRLNNNNYKNKNKNRKGNNFMEYKEKSLLEDLRQELLEEKALTTILGDHFNIRIEIID